MSRFWGSENPPHNDKFIVINFLSTGGTQDCTPAGRSRIVA
jgi:hypothetical protein